MVEVQHSAKWYCSSVHPSAAVKRSLQDAQAAQLAVQRTNVGPVSSSSLHVEEVLGCSLIYSACHLSSFAVVSSCFRALLRYTLAFAKGSTRFNYCCFLP